VLKRAAFPVATAVPGLALAGSALPAPLFLLYESQLGLSPFTISVVYSAYCAGVLLGLLPLGALSDQLGRRPVMFAGLAGLAVCWVAFTLATSATALIAVRLVQGVTTAVAIGAAAAAMLDLHPRGDHAAAGRILAIVSASGLGIGGMAGAILARYAPHPLVTPYLALLGVTLALMAMLLGLPETVRARRAGRLRFEMPRPTVPRAIRRVFALAALGAIVAWPFNAIFQALTPRMTAAVADADSLLVSGVVLLILCGGSIVPQLLWPAPNSRHATVAGLAILAFGTVLVLAALHLESAVALMAVCWVPGFGFGLVFMSGFRIVGAIAPEGQRAAVMSAFYVIGYGASSAVPALMGLGTARLGLDSTFRWFTLSVLVLAPLTALGAWRMEAFGRLDQTTVR
jgi:MFS family permease